MSRTNKALSLALLLAVLGGCATGPSGDIARASAEEGVAAPQHDAPPLAQTETPGGIVPGGALPPGEAEYGTRLSPPPDFDEEFNDNDPFEAFNRKVYAFNDFLDRHILQPVARGYRRVTPEVVQRGIGNFFSNLFEPTVIINDLLQGKFKQSLADSGRFVLNSTVGLFGLFDVATGLGLEKHQEDFGQTLAVWGVPDGPFLVLPLLGPRNVRDTAGFVVDWYTDPVTYLEDSNARWSLRAVTYIDTRARLLGASRVLEEATDDPYLFLREAYRQRRQSLIYDGQPPRRAFP